MLNLSFRYCWTSVCVCACLLDAALCLKFWIIFSLKKFWIIFNNVCCAPDGLVASRDKIKASPCQRDNDSQGGELDIQIPNLPEVRYAILLIVGLAQVTCQWTKPRFLPTAHNTFQQQMVFAPDYNNAATIFCLPNGPHNLPSTRALSVTSSISSL